jgi:O-antigen/teichoic acid export membrane protein
MILAKMASVEVVGIFAVGRAFCLPISRFLGLQLTIVQTTDTQEDYYFGHYYALRVITAILAIGLSVLIGSFFYSGEIFYVIIFMSIGYAAIAIREIFLGCMRKSERMDIVAVSHTSLGMLSVILFSLIFLVTRSLSLSILGLVVARIAIIFFYDASATRKLLNRFTVDDEASSIRLLWSTKVLWNLVKTSLPLGLVALFQTLYVSTPRLVLDKYFGKGEVGYFAAMSSLLVIGMMVIAALGHAVTPRLAKYYFENLKAYKKLLARLLGIGLVLGISGIVVSSLFGKLILTLLFRSDYAEHNDVFIWIMVAGTILFLFNFMNTGLNAARRFKVQMPIHCSTAVTCLVVSLLLIPNYGMVGAVWSVMACYIVGLVGATIFVAIAVKERTLQEINEGLPNAAS